MEAPLIFLGRGNAFNYLEDNNSAYFIKNDTLYLFDCGQKIATKIIYLKLLDKIKKVTIFMTHLHPDHVASLPELLTYIYLFYKDVKVNVVFKNKERLLELLKLLHYDFDVNIISDYKDDYLEVKTVDQVHVPYSYGYIVKTKDCSFFFSGDTCVINEEALIMLKNDQLDYFYHEVSKNQSNFHTGIVTLNEAIPLKIRNKVYLMHFEDNEIIEECIKNGYNVAKTSF